MRKKLFIFLTILTTSLFSYSAENKFNEESVEKNMYGKEEGELKIKSLEQEYHELLEKEELRFQEEKQTAQDAIEENINLEAIKLTLEEKILSAPKERGNKFFKDTFDELIGNYKIYLKKVEKKISDNKTIIDNFQKIQAMR